MFLMEDLGKMLEHAVEILLVEDNPNDVDLTLHALREKKIGNHIHIVKDGQEALDFLFDNKSQGRFLCKGPKVVLLDLKLPKIDGLEVLQRIKSNPITKRIPVVMLTSSKEETDIVKSYDLGVNSYIVKPVDFNQFTEAIKDLGVYWVLYNEVPH